MSAVCLIIAIASLLSGCLSMEQINTTPGPSSALGANPSLLLSLLDTQSGTSSNPLPPGAAQPIPPPSQPGSSVGSTPSQGSPLETNPQPTGPASNSNHQTIVPGTSQAGPANLLTPNTLNQRFANDLALLSSSRHTLFNMALAKSASVANEASAAQVYKLIVTTLQAMSAQSLGCSTAGEAILGEDMAFLPVPCKGMCPRGTSCKTIGKIGFCCPRSVTTSKINMHALFGSFDM